MISVVIPAYNEELNLPATLNSLIAQTCDEKFEVIVVDNGSTDKTAAVALTFADKLHITVVHEPVKGRGAARAAGCAAATGNYLLSTDADTTVPHNWITNLVAELRAGAVGVTGTTTIADKSVLRNTFFNLFQPLLTGSVRIFFGHYWLAGFSSAVTKEVYEKAGGYDPGLNAIEDIDLARRVARLGKITLVSGCPVVFSSRRFRLGMLRGLWSYVPPFVAYVLRRPKVHLADVR